MTISAIFFLLINLGFFLGLLALSIQKSSKRMWVVVVTTSAFVCAVKGCEWIYNHHNPSEFGYGLFFQDTLSLLISSGFSFVGLLIVVGLPIKYHNKNFIASLLTLEWATLVLYQIGFIPLVPVFWLVSLMPFYFLGVRDKIFYSYQLMAVGLGIFSLFYSYHLFPVSTLRWFQAVSVGGDPGDSGLLLILFSLVGLLRQGIFPCHQGIFRAGKQFPYPLLILWLMGNTGLYWIVRYGVAFISISSSSWGIVANSFLIVGLFLLCVALFVTDDLRELFIQLMGMQTLLILLGFIRWDLVGASGALVQWFVAILAGTGFGICLCFIEARCGWVRISQSRLSTQKMPRLSALFFVFGIAMVDFPGTLGFISEDLMLHSLLHISIYKGMAILVSMALASIVVYYNYLRLFLGRSLRSNEIVIDLQRKEVMVLFVLLAALVGFGFTPSWLLRHTQSAIQWGQKVKPF